jgi:hypothetical protein
VRISVELRNFDGAQGPRVKSGPDVFADALVPVARAFGAGALSQRFPLKSIFRPYGLASPTDIDPVHPAP